MALNFPPNPQIGDQYVGDNGVTYIWDGVKWAGQLTQGGGGGGGVANIEIRDEGTTATTSTTVIDFIGEGVVTTATGTTVIVRIEAKPLTTATTATLGGVKIGTGISITDDGVISVREGLQYWTENLTIFGDTSTAAVSLITTGETPDIDAVLKAKGNGATLADVAGNKRGIYATDWQKQRGNNIHVASGDYAVISGGSFNQASGLHSVVIGGNNNTNNADYATVLGGVNGNTKGIRGAVIIPGFATGGAVNSSGLIQTGYYILSAETNSASPQRLTTDGNPTASTSNQIVLFNNSAIHFKGSLMAKGVESSTSTIKAWNFEGVIRRKVGSTSTEFYYDTSAPVANLVPGISMNSWSVVLDVDNVTGCLIISVQGTENEVIKWAAKVETLEISDQGI